MGATDLSDEITARHYLSVIHRSTGRRRRKLSTAPDITYSLASLVLTRFQKRLKYQNGSNASLAMTILRRRVMHVWCNTRIDRVVLCIPVFDFNERNNVFGFHRAKTKVPLSVMMCTQTCTDQTGTVINYTFYEYYLHRRDFGFDER